MATLSSLTVSDTGSTLLPQGTVAERPGYSVQVFTATGAATFSVPTGITAVDVLVVGAGGAGGAIGGGGGGGGVVYYPNYPVTPAGTVPLTVGVGGAPGGTYPAPASSSGGNSTFGPLTALGGGGAGSWNSVTPNPGGSGAGGPGTPGTGTAGGTAGQPGQPNPGGINYGFPGAAGGSNPSADATTGAGTYTGGGGGGAGQAGGHPSKTAPGNTSTDRTAGRKGGDGIANAITGYSQFYGGGGGGASHYTPGGYASPVALAMGGAGGGGKGGSVDFHYDALFPSGFPGTGGVSGGPGSNGAGPASLQLNTGLNLLNPTSGMPVASAQGGYGAGEPGIRNTGGGGGGGSYYTTHTSEGGRGAPGVVVVRYANPNTEAPTTGMIRYNTEGGYMEVYNGTIWTPVKKTVVSFVQTGTTNWKVPVGIQAVDILVVGGGGSGGALGGGGGAGGHLYATNVPVQPGGTIPVSVGIGGFGVNSFPPHWNVRKGSPSRFGGYEAYGGGGGANHPSHQANWTSFPSNHPLWGGGGAGSPGASGGGASHALPGQYGMGISGQGYPGGDAPNPAPHSQGGGGGAGAAGTPAPRGSPNPTSYGGPGGAGVANSITGTSVVRGGGGGGGSHGGAGGGDGGAGGGGQGGKNNASGGAHAGFAYQKFTGSPAFNPGLDLASPGQDNTGGGGGGSGHNSGQPYGTGGNGGPGIVIVRY